MKRPEMLFTFLLLASSSLAWKSPQETGTEEARRTSLLADAERGDAQAQTRLGFWYFTKDKAQAAFWYRKAAEQGNAEGQRWLGSLFENGWGVEHDAAQAAFWYRKGAEQGDEWAQSSLARLYEKGEGVPLDYAAAVTWYRKAAASASKFPVLHSASASS